MLRKVTPGTSLDIRASEFNGWQEAVAFARAQQHKNKPVPREGLVMTGRITEAVRDGSNWRWSYKFTRVIKSTAGYGGWIDHADGPTAYPCFNLNEDQNGTTGRQGNGVDVANLGDCEIQPVPVDTLVRLWAEGLGDGKAEFWFVYENGVDLP